MKLFTILLVILSISCTSCTKSAIEGLSLPQKESIPNSEIPPVEIVSIKFDPFFGQRGKVIVAFSLNPDYILPKNETFKVEVFRNSIKRDTQRGPNGTWGDIFCPTGYTFTYQVHLVYDSGLPSKISEPWVYTVP